ncbi:hypothetical protein ACROYT_G017964 [Oculina patagonica]
MLRRLHVVTSYRKASSSLFVIVVLTSVVSSLVQSSSCPGVNLTPHKTLKRLRQSFMFVEKQSSLGISKRVSRDVSADIIGDSTCPWTWGVDDNPDRVPRYLSKAKCPGWPRCKHYCKAVSYSHKGLVQKCDARTGEKVWEWTVVELPVAFVYKP